MDERIARFIIREHIMHIAIREDEGVYNASCFYAFDRKNLALIFKSDPASHHIMLAKDWPYVGISIAKNTRIIKRIQGLQAKGFFTQASDEQKQQYYETYPFGRAIKGQVYALEILWCKYTDNSLLRLKKLEYQKQRSKDV